MKLADMEALKVGDRVVVSGVCDDETFSNDAGVVVEVDPVENRCSSVAIQFDDRCPRGRHGPSGSRFYFWYSDCTYFTIEPEHRSTYLNGHSDLKQEGAFVTAWKGKDEDGGGMWFTGDEPFGRFKDADDSARKLVKAHPDCTVVVLRAVREYTSSVEVTSKPL